MDYKTLTVIEDEGLNDGDGDLGESANALDMLSN
jgi:hypothetical protein